MTQLPEVPAEAGLYPSSTSMGISRAPRPTTSGAVTIGVAVAREPRRLGGVGDLTDRGLQLHQQQRADSFGIGTDNDVGVEAIAEGGDVTFWAEPLAMG